eukprot:1141740-Pelagomonas_calceolata.AAC.4
MPALWLLNGGCCYIKCCLLDLVHCTLCTTAILPMLYWLIIRIATRLPHAHMGFPAAPLAKLPTKAGTAMQPFPYLPFPLQRAKLRALQQRREAAAAGGDGGAGPSMPRVRNYNVQNDIDWKATLRAMAVAGVAAPSVST